MNDLATIALEGCGYLAPSMMRRTTFGSLPSSPLSARPVQMIRVCVGPTLLQVTKESLVVVVRAACCVLAESAS
jgi:hypothetical protein